MRSLPLPGLRNAGLGLAFSFGLVATGAAPLMAQCPPGGYPPPFPDWGGGTAAGPGSSGPAGPSTPSPSGPSTPGPTGPATPGPAGPSTGGPGATPPVTGLPRGPAAAPVARMPITFTRGQTSKNLLDIEWDYPVIKPVEVKTEGTRVQPVFEPLPVDEAFAALAGDDPRPLLVVRECPKCQGSDAALLHPKQANDRTILLTHYFHCVKLPPSILHDSHPYRKVFEGREDAHVFLSAADGSGIRTLGAMHAPSALWRLMSDVLQDTYEGDPGKNATALLRLLDQFDRVDEQEKLLFEAMEKELETNGPRSPKLAKLRAKRTAIEEEKAELKAQHEALRNVPLQQNKVSGEEADEKAVVGAAPAGR